MIINADDFGRDEIVNRAIAVAFQRGLISSTTLMANQPGFGDAVEVARELRLEQHVGVHLVLTSGRPLTEPIRRSLRFCDEDGDFRSWRGSSVFWLDRAHRAAVVGELSAQVARVQGAGLPVTHVDSHHHTHNEWAIGGCVLVVARSLGVPYVRIARNCGAAISVRHAAYKAAFNRRLRRTGHARTRWFGDVADWSELRARRGADDASLDDFELMTHPTIDERGDLVDSGLNRGLLAAQMAPIQRMRRAISYAGVRYEG